MHRLVTSRVESRRPRALRAAGMTVVIVLVSALQFVVAGVIRPTVVRAAPSVQTTFPLSLVGYYSNPTSIVSGPGGALWFAEGAPYVEKLTTSVTLTAYATSANPSDELGDDIEHGIAVGPDGNLWVTQQFTWINTSTRVSGVIARVTPSGTVTYFPTPTAGSNPYEITTGPAGDLWFTENAANRIGVISTGGTIHEYQIPTTASRPNGIVAGPDGNLWFTENAGDKIGRMTTVGAFAEFPVTTGSHPHDITVGPDGNLWFTEAGSNKIGTMTTSGAGYVEYSIPTTGSTPVAITSGPDGALWFAENNGNQIGRITTGGAVTEYASTQVPNFTGSGTRSAAPYGITSGPDGNIWYTDYPIGRAPGTAIGRLPLAPCGDLTTSVSSQSGGTGLRDTPGSHESLQINLKNCGVPTLTSATTSTTVTPPSGCPSAPAIPSFTSTLAFGQSTSNTPSFVDPSCLGAYTVTSTTAMGSTAVATYTTYYVVSNGRGSHVVGDFNGDGYADLAVNDGGSSVSVYYGGPNGIDTRDPQVLTPQTPGMPSQLAPGCADCGFGLSLVAGAFNGSGYSELAIGVPGYGYPSYSMGDGAVVVLQGGPAGLTTNGSKFIAAPSSLTLGGTTSATGFGWSLASADFNHDGYADLVIGSPFATDGSANRAGAVTIMYGSASGLTSAQKVVNQATVGIAGPAAAYDDGFGWELAVGDFKHNGFSDVAIAVPHEDGDVVLYGSATGLTMAGSQYLQGAGGQAYQVAAGDFNGNGYDDLAVGQSCISMVEIHYGGASGLGSVAFKTAQEITPTKPGMPAGAAGGYFGESLAVGDIKHDGHADLVVSGSPLGPIALWGTSTKLTTKGSAVVGVSLDTWVYVALGDWNGDGYADLLSYTPYTSMAGIYNGSSTGVAHTPSSTLAHSPFNDSVRGAPATLDQLCGGP